MQFVAEAGETFVFPEKREMVDEARAAELLESEGVASVTAPIRLDLSNKSYSDAAATKLAEKLALFSSITDADIHDMIAGRPEEEALRSFAAIADSLVQNPIVALNISDNALGAKGVEACRDLMIKGTLQRIYVLNNGISEAAAELIYDLLFAQGDAPVLKVFNFYNNMCGNGGAAAVAKIVDKSPLLIDLRYSATRSNADGMSLICKSILNLKHLVSLDLADNTFGDEVGEVLAEGIAENLGLTYLNLRDAALGDGGVAAVLSALKGNSVLAHLDLSGNDLTEAILERGKREALAAIFCKSTLAYFALDDNELGSDGAIAVAAMISSSSSSSTSAAVAAASGADGIGSGLETLSMCCCEVTACGAMALAQAVSGLASMEMLLLDGNEICERGVGMVATVLQSCGKTLGEMEDNDDEGEDDLGEDYLCHNAVESDDGADIMNQDVGMDELESALRGTQL